MYRHAIDQRKMATSCRVLAMANRYAIARLKLLKLDVRPHTDTTWEGALVQACIDDAIRDVEAAAKKARK